MIVGSCARCGRTLYHDSRFVRDELHAYCADHAPVRPATPPEEGVEAFVTRSGPVKAAREMAPIEAFSRGKEKVTMDPPIFTSLGIDPEAARLAFPQMADVSGEITKELIEKAARPHAVYTLCERCELRAPMDGADFCGECANEGDFDYKAISENAAKHAATAVNRIDCPACAEPAHWGYRSGTFCYHMTCAYRISKEARAERACGPGQIPRRERSIDELRREMMKALGGVTELTAEQSMRLSDAINAQRAARSATEAAIRETYRDAADAKQEAAERLARLVLDEFAHYETEERVMVLGRFLRQLVSEALRVIGKDS